MSRGRRSDARVDRFESTETGLSILLRVRIKVGLDPDRITRSTVLVLHRDGEEIARVSPLRDSASADPSAATWSAAFVLPRSMFGGRRVQPRFGTHRHDVGWRRDLSFELQGDELGVVELGRPTAIPRLELVGAANKPVPASVVARSMLRRYWRALPPPVAARLPAAAAIVAAAAAAIALVLSPPEYSSTTLLVASPLSSQDPALAGLPILTTRGNASATFTTAQREIAAPAVARLAALRLGAPWTERRVIANVSVTSGPSPAVIAIVATAPLRRTALRLAQTYASAALALRARKVTAAVTVQLDRARAQLAALGGGLPGDVQAAAQRVMELSALEHAGDPTLRLARSARVSLTRGPGREAALVVGAGLCGLILGAFARWLEGAIGRRPIATARHVSRLTGWPLLAALPPADQLALPQDATSGPVSQALGGLFTLLAWDGRMPRSIAVLEPGAGEGATMAALAVASHASGHGTFTNLVELDWVELRAARQLGVRLPPRRSRETHWHEFVEHLSVGGPLRISASLAPPDASGIRTQIAQALQMAGLVVVHAPPVTVTGDALAAAQMVDAVIVAVSLGRTSEHALREMIVALARIGVSPAGVVVFGASTPRTAARGRAAASRYGVGTPAPVT